MNAWQRFWQRRSRKARRRVRRRIAAVRFRRLRCEQFEPRVVLAAPMALGDYFAATEDFGRYIAAPGVLANDTDADSPLTDLRASLVLNTPATAGTVTLGAEGAFTFRPKANFIGVTSFTYQASDGQLTSGIATVTIQVSPTNDAPVAKEDLFDATEDMLRTIAAPGVLLNDSDLENGGLIAVIQKNASRGAVFLGLNGGFTYTPTTDFNGLDSFTYRASDGQTTSNIATVTLSVGGVNDPPVATSDAYLLRGNCDLTLSVAAPGVLANDRDIENDALVELPAVGPAHGTLISRADGGFAYLPATNFTGLDSFSYRASDGQTSSGLATVTISVFAPGAPPVIAANDRYSFDEDTTLSVTAGSGILANDFGSGCGIPAAAALATGPAKGTLTLAADGSFGYASSLNFFSADSFTYRASDGTSSSGLATVTLNVQPVNDPPVAKNDLFIWYEGAAFSVAAPGALGNDTNVDADPLTAILVSGPSHGVVTLNGDGSFVYSRNLCDQTYLDSFVYRVNNTSLTSDAATVTIQIPIILGDPPVPVGIPFTVFEDTPLTVTAPGVLGPIVLPGTCGRPDFVLTLHGPAQVVSPPGGGSFWWKNDGSFTYYPQANFSGVDQFTFRALDDQQQAVTQWVSIYVSSVNDPPSAGNDSFIVTEDTPRALTTSEILFNDQDADGYGSPLTAVLNSGPSQGWLTLSPSGNFTYIPSANFNGKDSFTYRALDGITTSNLATVTLNVTPVNDAPVANIDNYATRENLPLTIAPPGVLLNDLDVDGDSLTVVPGGSAQHGALSLAPSGGFTYFPADGFTGLDSFSYRAFDGMLNSNTATVYINVQWCQWCDFALDDQYTATEDVPRTVGGHGVLENDFVDPDTDPVMAILDSSPARGTLAFSSDGRFTYSPPHDFNGNDSFTYHFVDGFGTSNLAKVTLNVVAVNDPPVAVGEIIAVTEDTPLIRLAASGVLANDSDPDNLAPPLNLGLAATVVPGGGPQHAGTFAFSSTGAYTYTPASNFSGPDSFTYRATDLGGLSSTATVTLNVQSVNDAPTAVGDKFSPTPNATLTVPARGILNNDTDPDPTDVLAVVNVLYNGTGSLNVGTTGAFTYVPPADPCFVGQESFTYQAFDGTTTSNVATVTLSVFPGQPHPPIAANDSYSVTEDVPRTVSASESVLSNDDGNPCDGPLVAHLELGPAGGTLSFALNGTFTYLPAADFQGVASFTYRAFNGLVESINDATVTLNVLPVNDAPTFTKGPNQHVTDDNGPRLVAGWAKDISPGPPAEAGQTAAFSIVGNTNPGIIEGDIVIDPAGKLSFTPQPNVEGTATITVRLQDSGGTASGGIDFSEQQFQITVDKLHRWHNEMPPLSPHDRGGLEVVFEDAAHSITPTDVLLVINYLNSGLPTAIDATAPLANGTTRPFYDVDGDDVVTPTDALLIIDVLNAGLGGPVGGEGEGSSIASKMDSQDVLHDRALIELIATMSFDTAEQTQRRRGM